MPNEYVIPYDLGCQPRPSGAGEIVIHDQDSVYVLFHAVSLPTPSQSLLADMGVALIECHSWGLTRCGYPNDEGLPEHPLYHKGLADVDGIGEVVNSAWKATLEAQMEASARRIWGDGYERRYAIPHGGKRQWPWKHLIFLFKETTFECITEHVHVTYAHSYRDILAHIQQKLLS